jgi:hypothetical protein
MEKRAGNRGQGRPKGAVNKVSKSVKEMILGAIDELNGQEYFVTLARENPAAFASLIKHITPQETKQIEEKNDGKAIKTITIIHAENMNK